MKDDDGEQGHVQRMSYSIGQLNLRYPCLTSRHCIAVATDTFAATAPRHVTALGFSQASRPARDFQGAERGMRIPHHTG